MRNYFVAISLLLAPACGDDGQDAPRDAAIDAPSSIDASCFDLTNVANPSHEEIINACTTAQKIYKDTRPPLLNADGSLPPLPP